VRQPIGLNHLRLNGVISLSCILVFCGASGKYFFGFTLRDIFARDLLLPKLTSSDPAKAIADTRGFGWVSLAKGDVIEGDRSYSVPDVGIDFAVQSAALLTLLLLWKTCRWTSTTPASHGC
jgi:hypothetical protein